MTQISIRELQRNASKYLEEEVVITRYNIPVARLTPISVGDLKKISEKISQPSIPVTIAEKEPVFFKLCQAKMCTNYAVEGSDFCEKHI